MYIYIQRQEFIFMEVDKYCPGVIRQEISVFMSITLAQIILRNFCIWLVTLKKSD